MEIFPNPVSKDSHQKILFQMNNLFYKFNIKDEKRLGICMFLFIKYQKKNIPVLITNYELINEQYLLNNNCLDIFINNEIINIELAETKYLNKDYNLTILEIKENKIDNINFIEINEPCKEKDSEFCYNNESIYSLFYNYDNNKSEIYAAYGIINYINKSEFLFKSNLDSITNISPIFNLSNNNLIGIYKNSSIYYNKGIFLNMIISEFIKEYKNTKRLLQSSKNEINIIDIKINVNKNDINKKIFFSDYNGTNLNLKKLNDNKTELYINNKRYEYKNYFIPEKCGEYYIKLKFKSNLSDCSYMFYKCYNITSINFIYFNTKYITNMEGMFYDCTNLKSLNLFSFKTENAVNMSYMFYRCYNLYILDLSSFDIKNVMNMNYMFDGCNNLKNLNSILPKFYKQNPKMLSVRDIVKLLEKNSIDSSTLSPKDLCGVNIILLFALSLSYMKSTTDCTDFLGSLFQNFIIFKKSCNIILNMVILLYDESMSNKKYHRALKYLNLFYLCINFLRSSNLIPYESLMEIIDNIYETDFESLLIENNREEKEGKKEDDKDKNSINRDIKLYGIDLPEKEITLKNLYVFDNFNSEKIIPEKDLVSIINSHNKKNETDNIFYPLIFKPKIRFNNGINKIESYLYSQCSMNQDLFGQYKDYIIDVNEKKLKFKMILDVCLNILIFIRNSDFNDIEEIKEMVKKIFYTFLNQLRINNNNN